MFEYVGSGGVMVGGCAPVEIHPKIFTLYNVGSIVFVAEKAAKGIIEAIAIKSIRIINNRKTYGKNVALYKDTLNGLWNEWELITQTDAEYLADAYLAQQTAYWKQYQITCRWPPASF